MQSPVARWDLILQSPKPLLRLVLGSLVVLSQWLLSNNPVFVDPLREKPKVGGCCGVKAPFQGKPVWSFWQDSERKLGFRDTAIENAVFLTKWLMLAYTIEALMIRYIPAEWVAQALGGEGVGTIILASLHWRARVFERLCRRSIG